jgi:hypothetical protein
MKGVAVPAPNRVGSPHIDPVGLRGFEDHLPHQPSGGIRHGTYSPSVLPASSLSSTPIVGNFNPANIVRWAKSNVLFPDVRAAYRVFTVRSWLFLPGTKIAQDDDHHSNFGDVMHQGVHR